MKNRGGRFISWVDGIEIDLIIYHSTLKSKKDNSEPCT